MTYSVRHKLQTCGSAHSSGSWGMRFASMAFAALGLLLALLVKDIVLLRGELLNSYVAFVLIIAAVSGFAFFNYRLWSESKTIIS